MNDLFLCLPVLLPIAAGFAGYAIPFKTRRARSAYYGAVISLTAVLAWAGILLCRGEAVKLLTFTESAALVFRMDGAGTRFSGLAAALWPFTMVYAFDYMRHEEHLPMFWCFFTAVFGITLGIAWAGNLLTMYLFYELLTLATIPLVMHAMHKKAVRAGIKYALYSMIGAALACIALVYCMVGGADVFAPGGHALTGRYAAAVFVLGFVGFGAKAAIWPLHSWLPSAAVAPTPVTALLHAVAVVKAGAFACIRLTYYVFDNTLLTGTWAQTAVMALSIFTLLFGSCMALKQQHLKRRLAYSTVSNLSYILFAVTLMSPLGLLAAFLHMIVHSVIKILAFFNAGSVLHYAHREWLSELEGLGRRMPWTFGCFTAAACALTGIPAFNGFVSKWYLALAAVENPHPLAIWGFGALLVSALLTAVYMFQIVIRAWFPRRDLPLPENAHEAGPLMVVPMVLLAAMCVLGGIAPGWLLGIIGQAVGV